MSKLIAENLNHSAKNLIETADSALKLVNELGNDWASEGYDDNEVVGRHSALRALTEYAANLYKRSAEKRLAAFEAFTKED